MAGVSLELVALLRPELDRWGALSELVGRPEGAAAALSLRRLGSVESRRLTEE